MLPLTDGLTGKKVRMSEQLEAPRNVPANDCPVKLLSNVSILCVQPKVEEGGVT